jgi:hypothetical protein
MATTMTLLYIWLVCGLVSAAILSFQLSRAEDPVSRTIRSQPYGPFAVVTLSIVFGAIGLAVVVWEILTDAVYWIGDWWMRNIGIITIRISWKLRKIDITQVVYEPNDDL